MWREQYLVIVVTVILILALVGLGLLAWFLVLLIKRRLKKSEVEIIVDAIDGTREQVDSHARHTALEHQALGKQLQKANGRLQFLVAKDVADELTALKAAGQEAEDDHVD